MRLNFYKKYYSEYSDDTAAANDVRRRGLCSINNFFWNHGGRFIIIYNNYTIGTYRVVGQKYYYITAPVRVLHHRFNHYIIYVFIFIATAASVPRSRLLLTSPTALRVSEHCVAPPFRFVGGNLVSHYRSGRIASFTSIGRSYTEVITLLELLFSRIFYFRCTYDVLRLRARQCQVSGRSRLRSRKSKCILNTIYCAIIFFCSFYRYDQCLQNDYIEYRNVDWHH